MVLTSFINATVSQVLNVLAQCCLSVTLARSAIRAVPKGGIGGRGAAPPQVHYIMQYSENSILFGNFFEVMKYCAAMK